MPPPASQRLRAVLELEDGSRFEGESFGAARSVAGEVVFNTGMVGYPETLTDPSYHGQILVCTYPLIGNYGVPADGVDEWGLCRHFESARIQVEGLVVADYSWQHHHWNAARSLSSWLAGHEVPALTGIDTRALTRRLREKGTMLGVVRFGDEPVPFRDPNREPLVAAVSREEARLYVPRGEAAGRVVLLDCGAKLNIIRSLVTRGVEVLAVPFDHDLGGETFDALVVGNGPGDPRRAEPAIASIRKVLDRGLPTLGICLGNQLLALAIGARTYKLKYGHRGQNQPVREWDGHRCFVTSQNHGYAVDLESLPDGWQPWFVNLNDGTCEGLRHEREPYRSVQFHPEAVPGPLDTAFLFDEFIEVVGP